MGEELATLLKIPFFETSAKENVNIAKVFETLAGHVLKVMINIIYICANCLTVTCTTLYLVERTFLFKVTCKTFSSKSKNLFLE